MCGSDATRSEASFSITLTRLVGRPNLQLHKEGLWVLALWAGRIGRVDILPALFTTHDIVDFFALELGTVGDLLLDGEVVRTGRAGPLIESRLVLSDEEEVGACRTEEHGWRRRRRRRLGM